MNDTKESILYTSLRLFARDGYEAASVSQIAGELGITKGALYRHYKNKRDIFDCIIRKMEQNDTERAIEFDMPITGNSSASITLEQLVSFSLAQFKYWTEDDFASNFRHLLVIEQYRSDELQKLYQQYLADGQLKYVEELFTELGIPDAKQKSLEFFAPMFLYYSLYDKGENTDILYDQLKAHFNNFILENVQ